MRDGVNTLGFSVPSSGTRSSRLQLWSSQSPQETWFLPVCAPLCVIVTWERARGQAGHSLPRRRLAGGAPSRGDVTVGDGHLPQAPASVF